MAKFIFKVKLLGHEWEIRFLKRELMNDGNHGTCWELKRTIDIADDLTEPEARLVIAHELTHAVLFMCGRAFDEGLSKESICDTFAWHADEIIAIRDRVIKERFHQKGEKNG